MKPRLSSRKPPTGLAEGRPDDRLRGYPGSISPFALLPDGSRLSLRSAGMTMEFE